MRMQPLSLLLILGLLAFGVHAAEKEKPKDKKKEQEEKLKEEIEKKLAGNQESWLPKVGKFHFNAEDANDDKPLPKVIGTLDELKGSSYQVMVFERSTIDMLKQEDNKQVNLMGKLLEGGGEKGQIWLTNGPVASGGGAPPARRKRGGL